MKIIGIVGGIASGKSFYSDLFEKQGAAIFKADLAGHEVLNERTIRQKIRQQWGDAMIRPDGSVDRSKLAKIVFQPDEESAMERLYLESLLFPAIKQRFEKFLDESETAGFYYIILDAALLLEAGWDKMCDLILFVDTPDEVRLERAIERGWTAEEFAAREATQFSMKKKRKKANFTLKGDLSPEDSEAALTALKKKFSPSTIH